MSWVPSPSPRLTASYREVQAPKGIPTVLGSVPARAQHAPSKSPTAASCAPSALSFGMATAAPPSMMPASAPPSMPYQAPRPQQRQGSFTPAPSAAQASPAPHRGMHPSLALLNTPYRLGSMNNIPYAAPASTPARELAFQNRSWTPLPSNSVLGGLERPKPSALDDRLSHSLTVLPFDFRGTDLLGSPAASPQGDQRPTYGPAAMGGGFANGDAQLMTNGMALLNGTESSPAESRRFSHKPKQRSFSQAPMPVIANIYWQRPVAFDQQGRVQRRLGGDDLSWRQKFLKDVLGVYHVGIEVHGQEYTFGNYRAPGARMVGGAGSGVYSHEPRRPGPQCVFKHAETLGSTTVAPGQVEDICSIYGNIDWTKSSYNKIHHNCVDFAKTLASKLGAGEIPGWCYRGAAIAKVMGLGGDPLEDSHESNPEISGFEHSEGPVAEVSRVPTAPASVFQIPAVLGDPGINGRQAAMDLATRSHSGTYVAPPPLPGPLAGSRNGTYVAPPLSGTYVGPPLFMNAMSVAAAPSAMQASFAAGSRVSVLQNDGCWLRGSIVMERPREYEESTYTIMYDQNFNTEVNVAQHRLVPLPEGDVAPMMQSLNIDVGISLKGPPPPVFQGLASADSILEPLKQGKSFGNIAGTIPRHINNHPSNGRVAAWPQAKAAVPQRPQVPPAASFNMGGIRRHSAGPPPSAMSFGTASSAVPSLRSVRPSTGSFQPGSSGYPTGARAPAQVPQMMMPRSNMPRGRDTLGATIGGTMHRGR